MEVFKTSGQKSGGSAGSQGQQDSTSVFDHTASAKSQTSGTSGTDCTVSVTDEQDTAGLELCAEATAAGTSSSGDTGSTAGTDTGNTGAGTGNNQSSAGPEQGTFGSGGQTQAGGLPGANGSGSGGTGRRIIVVGNGSPAVTDAERVEAMDRELDKSMCVFDGVILSSRQEVIARTNETGAGQNETGIGGVSGEGAYSSESDSVTPPLLTAGGNSRDPNNMKTAGTLPDAQSDNRKGEYQNGGRPGNIPADISDGTDDDIVARQLREAAMQEKDPALQAKLWDEYRKYKQGVQAKK